ncbi:hypothetical protein AMATHDRAFT_7373 [Amanita thiersii Skay4041]|uniref:NB-ARC domain-containing protein n=1 Tax=Amanita thiersii Skay4041 TaxID=703135 RepID=A0A2A9NGI7_9AGAR|nr:hypothetical protein AMATHDRAFT_7373 [Amanita thiersii Skay4041]
MSTPTGATSSSSELEPHLSKFEHLHLDDPNQGHPGQLEIGQNTMPALTSQMAQGYEIVDNDPDRIDAILNTTHPAACDEMIPRPHDVVSHPHPRAVAINQVTMNQVGTASGFFHGSSGTTIGHGSFTEIHRDQYITTTNIFQPEPRQLSPPLHVAPKHLSSLFTGREEYLEKLRNYFNNPNTSLKRRMYLLYGLGGIGKTQICLKFIEEIEDEFPCVFWIDTSSEATITSSFKAIARNNDLFSRKDEPHQILHVISRMKHTWFMIYDNADGPVSLVQKYLPQGNRGNIIITSRSRALMRLTSNHGAEVIQMQPDEAGLLLFKATGLYERGLEEESCKKIVDMLGCIPLAVDMAGAYMQTTGSSPAQYLELFSKECKRLLSDSKYAGISDYGYTAYGAWEISMQRIELKALNEQHTGAQSAVKILNIIAFLHHLDVPLDIFKRAAVNYKANNVDNIRNALRPELLHLDGSGNWDQYSFNSGIQELLSFSLIQRGIVHDTLSMHPLVHVWIKDRLQDIHAKYQEATLMLCTSVVVDNLASDYAYWLSLVPHLKAHEGYRESYGIQGLEGVRIAAHKALKYWTVDSY